MEEYEESYNLEEEAADQEYMEGSYQEESGADPEEKTGEDQLETDESEEDSEEEAAEADPEEDSETVSGNDIVISGDVIVFPEGYDPGSEQLDTESIVQAIEDLNENMTAGFACTSFLLGVLAGTVIIAGFRLRRV